MSYQEENERFREVFNTEQAGRFLGGSEKPVSRRTLESWRLRGNGPAYVKLGGMVRYRRQDLEDYLKQQTRKSTSEA